jgi:hypothetical protein
MPSAARHAPACRGRQRPNAGAPFLRADDDEIVERKLPANGFPYAVRHRLLEDRLLVMAVLHRHRHPNFGTDRQPSPHPHRHLTSVVSADESFGVVSKWSMIADELHRATPGPLYVVACGGLDPLTERERRRWHPVGHDRAEAELLAARLDRERNEAPAAPTRPVTFGEFLTNTWIPLKRRQARATAASSASQASGG